MPWFDLEPGFIKGCQRVDLLGTAWIYKHLMHQGPQQEVLQIDVSQAINTKLNGHDRFDRFSFCDKRRLRQAFRRGQTGHES